MRYLFNFNITLEKPPKSYLTFAYIKTEVFDFEPTFLPRA